LAQTGQIPRTADQPGIASRTSATMPRLSVLALA